MSIMVDAEFKALIPPLSPEEYAQLEENCVREGIRDPLVVWATPSGTQILVDGHNRWKIAAEHGGMHFDVVEKKFDTRKDAEAWIIKNQLGRRNITAFVRSELALKLKPLIAAKAKANQRASGGAVPQKSAKPVDTRQELARAAGVSHDTIHKVETVMEHGTPEIQAKARSGEISTNEAYRQTTNLMRPLKKEDIVQKAREEREAFAQQKSEKVVGLKNVAVEMENRKILALEVSRKATKIFNSILEITDIDDDIPQIIDSLDQSHKDELIATVNNSIVCLMELKKMIGG
ncbi:MAG: hypothetical protein IIZ68_07545 [Clostridia bacterium]|nr:hypothetical protein [Clostridia bacterium]